MLSKKLIARRSIVFAIAVVCVAGAASAQIQFLPAPGTPPGDNGNVACMINGNLNISNNGDDCQGTFPTTQLAIGDPGNDIIFDATDGSASFSGGPVNFSGVTVQFSGLQAFSGTTTFNSTATFNNNLTTNGISNTGLVTTGSLSSNTIFANSATITNILSANGSFTDSLTIVGPATIDMGGNVVNGVAAGIADTDAVNVAQLNAATSGIATDITALETTTATHTTQIANLQTSDAAQDTAITNIETVNTTQTTEITALQATATTFDSRIDTLELIATDLDERIGKVDDRASAGTAAAVALSGAMFLPGKTFNLTGNVGSYRGAHAAALQFGALVSDHVAVNAGIAKGFNKGGKTAIRAGFTFGW